MKYDFNKIIIIILLLTSIGFGLAWYFSGDDESKRRIKELENEFILLEEEKKKLDIKISVLKEIYAEKDAEDKKMTIEVANAKNDVEKAKDDARKAKDELTKLKSNIEKTLQDIEDIKNNTKVLTDDELLIDIKKNLNK